MRPPYDHCERTGARPRARQISSGAAHARTQAATALPALLARLRRLLPARRRHLHSRLERESSPDHRAGAADPPVVESGALGRVRATLTSRLISLSAGLGCAAGPSLSRRGSEAPGCPVLIAPGPSSGSGRPPSGPAV